MIPQDTNNYKLNELIYDTWPNLYRPPHDFKPPSFSTVSTTNVTVTEQTVEKPVEKECIKKYRLSDV
jgi:hypothetical protein